MARRTAVALLVVVVAVVLYLMLWPVPIDPIAWTPPPAPVLAGPYALNDGLVGGRRLLDGVGRGPEDVAFDADGRLYTGFEDGRIFRLELPDGQPELYADTGGRPLGMVFDATGSLIVADARRGLLAVGSHGDVRVMATEAGGVRFGFTDDLDIGPDGTIYFSDASSKFGYGEDRLDILEHGGQGRLLAHDPDSGTTRVLLDGLQFANGVAVDAGGTFVLVAETGSYRVRRHWLSGPQAGTGGVLIDNLPGLPDNINLTRDGRLWVALVSPRVPAVDALAPRPALRKVVLRAPEFLQPDAIRHGLVVEVSRDGLPIRSLHDPSGTVALVTTAMEREGRLYLGSYRDPSLWEVPLR